MSWFRRLRDDPVAVEPVPTDESPEALSAATFSLVRLINASAGRLPVAAVVEARYVTDLLAQILATAQVRPLDVHTLVAVKGMLYDYLPTSLNRYLALDPHLVDVARPTGSTARLSLIDQLRALRGAAIKVLSAAQAQDVDALLTQGNFLQTKFTASDLDL